MGDATDQATHDDHLRRRAAAFSWIWAPDAAGTELRLASPEGVTWSRLNDGSRRVLNLICGGSRQHQVAEDRLLPASPSLRLMLGQDQNTSCDWWHPVTHILAPWPSQEIIDYVPDQDIQEAAIAGLLSPIGQRPGRLLAPSLSGQYLWEMAIPKRASALPSSRLAEHATSEHTRS